MATTLLLLAVAALVGIRLQRRDAVRARRLRERLWTINYALLIPIAAVYALLSIRIDQALVALVACWIAAWWLTVGAAGAWARFACRSPQARGATWMAGAFPNTGFLGFPLAYLAYGTDGLRLAILYDQLSLVAPAVVVSTMIARRHAPREAAADAEPPESLMRIALLSPPLWTVAILLVLRATLVTEPVDLELLGSMIGTIVGPYGFLLLGLSLPLGGYTHQRRRLVATAGAVIVRVALAPLLLLAVAWVFGVQVPAALLLIAAMPTAFHALIIGRLNALDAELLRLAVVVSSVLVIAATLVLAAT